MMNNLIEARQRYVLVDKPRREARAKVAKDAMMVLFYIWFGIAMTATLLGAVQLAFMLSH